LHVIRLRLAAVVASLAAVVASLAQHALAAVVASLAHVCDLAHAMRI
jgi:hypothetical protein